MTIRKIAADTLALALMGTAVVTLAAFADPSDDPRYREVRADFNGDGFEDSLFQPNLPGLRVVLQFGEPDGSLGTESLWWTSDSLGVDWSGQAANIIAGDFDGDRHADVLLQSVQAGGASFLLRADHDGHFQAISQTIPADLGGLDWTADRVTVVAGDFDGQDGAELLLQSVDELGVHYIVHPGETGVIGIQGQGWVEDHLGRRWTAPATTLHSGDFDGDGRSDLLLQPVAPPRPGHAEDDLYALVLADRNGEFSEVAATWAKDEFDAEWDPNTHELIVSDIDGDGISDVWLRARGGKGTNYLLLGHARGGFQRVNVKWSGTQSAHEAYIASRPANDHPSPPEHANEGEAAADAGAETSGPAARDVLAMGLLVDSNAPAPYTPNEPGALKGEFSVDPTGAATYQIPIAVPPGVAGMQPDLAFLYNSRGGNGHLGVGWSLSGLSAISRCPQTKDTDGIAEAARGVTITADDRFCLDGQRLMVKDGATYGAANAFYRTEIASFQLVQSIGGTLADGPDYFIVKDKAGLIREYGNSADSRIEHAPNRSTKSVWAINKIRDKWENYISFTYSEDSTSGEYYPTWIRYYNKYGVLIGQVNLEYESARPDKRSGYMVSGAVSAVNSRLANVYTYNGGSLVHNYRLLYGTGTKNGLSQLGSIQQCDRVCTDPGARRIGASEFAWQDGSKGFLAGPLWSITGTEPAKLLPMDVNGNGTMEVVVADGGSWRIKYGNTVNTTTIYTGLSTANQHVGNAIALDVNADGFTDLGIAHTSSHSVGANWGFYLATGNGSNISSTVASGYTVDHQGAYSKSPVAFDADGNLYPDLFFKRVVGGNNHLYVYKNNGSTWLQQAVITSNNLTGEQRITPIEWNGDGRPDIFIDGRNCQSGNACWNNVGVWRNDGNFVFTKIGGTALKKPQFVDVNGDGLTDFIDYESGNLRLYTNVGGAMQLTVTNMASSTGNFDNAQPIDYNLDGEQDLLVPRGDGYWHAYLFDGATVTDEHTGAPVVNGASSAVFDFDGNGVVDIGFLDSGAGYKVRPQQPELSGLMVKVIDGMGSATSIGYSPLNHMAHQFTSEGATISAPRVRHFTGPLPVVHAYSVPNGTDTALFTTFKYKGGKSNQYGRGFLGFSEIEANSANTGIVTTNKHGQEFPFIGMVTYSRQDTPASQPAEFPQSELDKGIRDVRNGCRIDWETKVCTAPEAPAALFQYTPGVKVSESTNTLAQLSLSEGVFPYVQQSVVDTFELNGGARYKRDTTAFEYQDGYGNPTRITVTTHDGNGANQHVTDTVNVYENHTTPSAWVLARLTSATVTTTVPGNPSPGVRTSSYQYSGASTGQLIQEKVQGGTALEMVKDYQLDNVFGLRIKETGSGSGVAPRETQFGYDSNGRFVTSVTNALGHVETRTWDGRFGTVASITDSNGNTQTTQYDGFGRVTLVSGPRPGVWRASSYFICSTGVCTSTNAVYRIHQTGSDGQERYTELDRLGREVLTLEKDWLDRWVISESAYDSKGRIYAKTNPYISGEPRCWTLSTYDAIGRVTASELPASEAQCFLSSAGSPPPSVATLAATLTRTATTEYSVDTVPGYQSLRVRTTDPTGRIVTRWTSPAGRLALIRETDGNGSNVDTQFGYDAWGNTRTVTDANGHVRTLTYNARGFKTAMTDPDMGSWTYTYNAFGELTSQHDANGNTASFTYDLLGRMTVRAEPEVTTTWVYDVANNCLDANGGAISCSSKGRLTSVSATAPTFMPGAATAEHYAYDIYGGLRQTLRAVSGKAFWTTFRLDSHGRTEYLRYPDVNDFSSSGASVLSRPAGSYDFEVRNWYTRGTHTKVSSPNGSLAYWTLQQTYAWGEAKQVGWGNGGTHITEFDRATQLPTLIRSSIPAGMPLCENYGWDGSGNLTSRYDCRYGFTETFGYDAQHRLTQVQRTGAGQPTITYTNSYDKIGNLQTRYASGAGAVAVTSYTYDPNHPHAVSSVNMGGTTKTYQYYANGNAFRARDVWVSWYSYNQPFEMWHSVIGGWSRFAYGPDRARWLHELSTTNGYSATYYAGAHFEREDKGIGQVNRYNIMAGGETIGYHTWKAGTTSTNYLHRDYQGSVRDVSGPAGAGGREETAYDAWGKRRNPVTYASYNAGSYLLTTALETVEGMRRGYTGHEHLDQLGLINMNGRIYDPEIARFLSADPFVQFPESTQGYNRYAYVNNNPMSYSDPSGYFSLKEAVNMAVGIVANVTLGPLGSAIAGYMSTGELRGAALGVVGRGLSIGISATYSGLAQVVASGITQGALSAAGGGRFGDGFLGGASSSLLGPTYKSAGRIGGSIIAGIVGGTLSKIGGGKFANGAISGAFAYAVSDAVYGSSREAALGGDAQINDEVIDPAERQRRFDQARRSIEAQNLAPNQEITFVNKYATYVPDADGAINLDSIKLHNTQAEARAAAGSGDRREIGGRTPLGGSRTTLYASAVHSGQVWGVASRSGFFQMNGVDMAKFVIMHEYYHGQGVRPEMVANTRALKALGY